MSQEVTLNANLTINNPAGTGGNAPTMSFTNMQMNQTAKNVVGPSSLLATTAGVVIPLGGVASPRWAAFQNLDPTNYVEIFNGSSYARNTCIARLLAASAGTNAYGDPTIIALPPDCVPYAKANTASCQIAFMIGDT